MISLKNSKENIKKKYKKKSWGMASLGGIGDVKVGVDVLKFCLEKKLILRWVTLCTTRVYCLFCLGGLE